MNPDPRHILEVMKSHGTRPFLIDTYGNRVLTYGECHRLACGIASELRTRNVRPRDRVALLLRNSVEFALLYFGCVYSGAVIVPVNPDLHRGDIDFILGCCGTRLTIHSPGTSSLIDSSRISDPTKVWCLPVAAETGETGQSALEMFDRAANNFRESEVLAELTATDLFYITFTSGTTSRPKGVAHKIGHVLRNATAFNDALGFGVDDRFMHVFPMAYQAGFLNTVLCPFLAGGSVVIGRAFDAESVVRFWDPVRTYRANVLWLAPSMIAALLMVDRNKAGAEYSRRHVRTVCVGTAPLPLKVKRDFEQRYGVEPYESYGMSELLFIATNSGKSARVDRSVSKLLPGICVRIVDEKGESVPVGKDGELTIMSRYRFAGYLNPETSQPDSSQVGEWFATGDVGHLDNEGQLYITARKKNLIIRGGMNISPAAVEEVLLHHEAVDQVAVVGIPHQFYGEQVTAVLKLKEGHVLATEQASLDELCKSRLAKHAVPSRFVQFDRLPTSVTGKIQKNKIREQLLGNGS